jgi:hypothetical protein
VEWGERLEKQLVLLPQNDPSIRQDRFNNIFSARMKTTSWFFHKRKLTGTEHCQGLNKKQAVLSNRNDFLRFRFLLLKIYGSGSDFWKSYGSGSGSGSYFWKVTVPVPVPAPYLTIKSKIFKKNLGIFFAFLPSKLFYKEKVYKLQQIYCEMWMKNFFNEVNQIHNVTVGAQSIARLCHPKLSKLSEEYLSPQKTQKAEFF